MKESYHGVRLHRLLVLFDMKIILVGGLLASLPVVFSLCHLPEPVVQHRLPQSRHVFVRAFTLP